jgi:hypothetical protein
MLLKLYTVHMAFSNMILLQEIFQEIVSNARFEFQGDEL